MDYRIDEMKASDWPQAAEIYMEGIRTKIATFQSEAPGWEDWDRSHCSTCRLTELIRLSEENGYWTLQSGIIRENAASLNLHKRCGFREIGYRERLGKMDNGKWHDVLLVERRSKIAG